jgi:hypothetical protein
VEKFNRDIDPAPAFVAVYSDLDFLVRNPVVAEAFATRERRAVIYKTFHDVLGKLSLAAVLLVMVALGYDLTLSARYGVVPGLEAITALVGAVGLLAQLVLILGSLKERWLLERFAAERLRCIKFQAFAAVAGASDAGGVAALAESFTRLAIANLSQELLGGRPALHEFNPDLVQLGPAPTATARPPQALLNAAQKAYEQLRLSVQAQHFKTQQQVSLEKDRAPAVVAELSFVLGGLVACLAIIMTGGSRLLDQHMSTLVESWLHFATWSFFAVSAVTAVYQRAVSRQVNAERYLRYAQEIRGLRDRYPHKDAASFAQSVREMEELALHELEEFSREAERSSYIF